MRLHPSSVLLAQDPIAGPGKVSAALNRLSVGQVPTEWFIFDEMTRAGHLAMIRGVTAVSPFTVLVFAGPNRLPMETVSEADAGVQGKIFVLRFSTLVSHSSQ